MKLKISILPGGRREWLWVVLQIVIFGIVFIAASFYVTMKSLRIFRPRRWEAAFMRDDRASEERR